MIISDWSEYQDAHTIDTLKLLVRNGVKGLILRAGCAHAVDDQVDKYIAWCKEIGIPYALYYYFYPGLGVDHQLEIFRSVIDKYPEVKSIWIDVEEYRNFTTGAVYSADWLNAFYKTIFVELQKAYPDKIVGNYSGGWVLDAYIPRFHEWARKYPYWNAHYVKYSSWWWNYLASLGATWSSRTKTVSIKKLPQIMREIGRHRVPNARGFNSQPDIWQCITYIPFTELTEWQCHIDLNIINRWKFNKYFNMKVPAPVPPVPEPEPPSNKYKVLTAVWVRDYPGGNIVAYKLKGWEVEVTSIIDGWAHVNNGWVYAKNLEKIE